jgi:hypothetical protein
MSVSLCHNWLHGYLYDITNVLLAVYTILCLATGMTSVYPYDVCLTLSCLPTCLMFVTLWFMYLYMARGYLFAQLYDVCLPL